MNKTIKILFSFIASCLVLALLGIPFIFNALISLGIVVWVFEYKDKKPVPIVSKLISKIEKHFE